MLELVLFGERLLVLRTPVALALLAASAIGAASLGVATARALKKRTSRIDRIAMFIGGLFGLVFIDLRDASSVSFLGSLLALRWIAALSIAAASGSLAWVASAALTRKRVPRLSAEAAIFELREAIGRVEQLASKAELGPGGSAAPASSAGDATSRLIAERLESLRQLAGSIERGVLSAACRAPIDRVLAQRPDLPRAIESAPLAQIRVRSHLAQLAEAKAAIEGERDATEGTVADRIRVPAGNLADDCLSAVSVMIATYEKLDQQLSAHLLQAEVDREAGAVLRLVKPLSEGIVPESTLSERTSELHLAEQMIAAADLSESIALALNAADRTTPLDRALAEATEATREMRSPGRFREVLATLRE